MSNVSLESCRGWGEGGGGGGVTLESVDEILKCDHSNESY